MSRPLIEVKGLKKYFTRSKGLIHRTLEVVKAVDGVSFSIEHKETFGLVGESGCGKSTTGRALMRLYDITDGEILFEGNSISQLNRKQLMPYRKKMQMIFQDPYSSLNTRMTVADTIGEPLDIHHLAKGSERREIIYELLDQVGLKREHASRYPHEFSGGQRQRIGIARALAVRPQFIVCDEPISALDVSIQAQVVNMLQSLQEKMGLTYLFIAHDLTMVRHISSRIGVMYLGSLVEVAPSGELYHRPLHPYTEALLSSAPVADPNIMKQMKRKTLQGEVASPINTPPGCKFQTRCPVVMDKCREQAPELKDIGGGHLVACYLCE